MIHALQMGPVKDRNRCRTVRHGALRVMGRTLLFVGNDGKQVSLTLDGSEDMTLLIAQLSKSLGSVKLSEVTESFCTPDEFVSDKVLHDGDADFSYGVRT